MSNSILPLKHLSFKDLQQRYFRLLEAMSEGVYGLDADGLATFVNPAAERITGWSSVDILGKNIHQFHHHSHADGRPYPDTDCPIYKTRLTGESAHCEHEVFWRKDGSCFPVEYSSTPIEEDEERQQFPLLISLAQPSLGSSVLPKLSSKTAIHIEMISTGFEQPINQIDTSFFKPIK
jgi:PAS domain S-box-containing protein